MDQESYDYDQDDQPKSVSNNAVNEADYQERYKKAKHRVEEIKGFYTHFAIYLCINVFLYILDLIDGGGISWAYWVTFGWGIAIPIHFFSVFGESIFLGRDWEERKIRELMDDYEKPKRRG